MNVRTRRLGRALPVIAALALFLAACSSSSSSSSSSSGGGSATTGPVATLVPVDEIRRAIDGVER